MLEIDHFYLALNLNFLVIFFQKAVYLMMNWDRGMKLKPGEAPNSKFSDYVRRSLISQTTNEFFKFENRTEKILSFRAIIV